MLILHPLIGSSLKNIFSLYANNKLGIGNLHRSLYIAMYAILNTPIRFAENGIFAKKVKQTRVKSPVFIIGHWRSGTTLLHNYLANDPQFTYLTMPFILATHQYMLTGKIIRSIGKQVKFKNRIIDNMVMNTEVPQEDELALANMSAYSCYHGFYFPDQFDYYFNQCLDLQFSNQQIETWKQQLHTIFQKLTFASQGKTILSKNPAHSARIKHLLTMYPDAKFIHIYRNPYHVHPSTVNAFLKLSDELSLGKTERFRLNVQDKVFALYKKLMKVYFSEVDLIPRNNITQVKFEDLERSPMQVLHQIYHDLTLGDFNLVKDKMMKYSNSLHGYQKNIYSIDVHQQKIIYQHLSRMIDQWGYQPDG